jgi:hypothetical protein
MAATVSGISRQGHRPLQLDVALLLVVSADLDLVPS